MRYFLGFDVGSSKTHALMVDETGCCVGFGQAGSGNHQGVGYAGLASVLRDSCGAARQMAGVGLEQIAGAGLGVAGYDFPSDREPHLQVIAMLGLACPIEVFNDGMNGLLAGATRGIGVNVTAGSSNNCRGRNRAGLEGRIVGNGSRFGEYGGGREIVLKALQLVNYAWIKRIPPTTLTQVFLNVTGARDELELIEALSNDVSQLVPNIAVEVVKAAQHGDAAAGEVVGWAGEELGWLAVAVARQIDMHHDAVEIIQSGSVFDAGEIILQPMRERVLKHCPRAKLTRLVGPPVIGAVILALEQAGVDGYAIRARIAHTAQALIP